MIDTLNEIDVIASLTQLAIGIALPLFKSFLLSENQFQDTIKLLKDKKIEALCETTLSLFDRALNESIPLRGEAGRQPDLILIHAKKSIETVLEINKLKKIHKRIELSFTYLIITFILGIVFLLISIIFPSLGTAVSTTSLIIISSQILVAIILRKSGIELKKFENL